jgi:hypothetical protein
LAQDLRIAHHDRPAHAVQLGILPRADYDLRTDAGDIAQRE